MNIRQCYRVLELEEGASISEIKNAYRKLALKSHPDRQDTDGKKFMLVLEAYRTILDEHKKNPDPNFTSSNNICHISNSWNIGRAFVTLYVITKSESGRGLYAVYRNLTMARIAMTIWFRQALKKPLKLTRYFIFHFGLFFMQNIRFRNLR